MSPAGGVSTAHMRRNVTVATVARGFMSTGRALAGVVIPVYLAIEGYSAARLGVIFAIVAITSMAISATVGSLSDRLGRRFFLVVVPLLTAGAAVAFALSVNPVVVLIGSAFGSFGRGGGAGGGSVGPYQPAEQALVAASVDARRRTRTFGRLAFASSLGALAGGVLAGVLAPGHPSRAAAFGAYRPVFVALAVCATVAGLLAIAIVEPPRSARADQPKGAFFPRRSAGLLYRLWITNSLNGAAMGLSGPFITYWFYRRFGVGADEIGVLYAVVNVASMAGNLSAARIARRFGLVRAVSVLRAVVAVMVVPLVLAPSFLVAGAIYLLRMATQRVVMPMRQSYVMGVADPEERARVSALSTLPAQGASAITPTLAGEMLDHVALAAPFLVAGVLQLANAVSYFAFFHRLAPEEERRRRAPAITAPVGAAGSDTTRLAETGPRPETAAGPDTPTGPPGPRPATEKYPA